LSACETALGDQLGDGKEILGLGFQMQRAGAKSTMATLWSVSDGGTQTLMNRFYDILAANPGITKTEALRQAQLTLLNNQRDSSSTATTAIDYSHPYYWSPFVLIGNGL
jgi:CHAT domain-containing protein